MRLIAGGPLQVAHLFDEVARADHDVGHESSKRNELVIRRDDLVRSGERLLFCDCLTASLDPPGRFRFHQIGQPLIPRYLWPLEQVFQPPLLALGIGFRWLECSSFRPVVDAQVIMRRRPFLGGSRS